MSTLALIGWGLISFSVGALLIETGRFTKTRDISGIVIYKDKKTGKEYATSRGFLKEL